MELIQTQTDLQDGISGNPGGGTGRSGIEPTTLAHQTDQAGSNTVKGSDWRCAGTSPGWAPALRQQTFAHISDEDTDARLPEVADGARCLGTQDDEMRRVVRTLYDSTMQRGETLRQYVQRREQFDQAAQREVKPCSRQMLITTSLLVPSEVP